MKSFLLSWSFWSLIVLEQLLLLLFFFYTVLRLFFYVYLLCVYFYAILTRTIATKIDFVNAFIVTLRHIAFSLS